LTIQAVSAIIDTSKREMNILSSKSINLTSIHPYDRVFGVLIRPKQSWKDVERTEGYRMMEAPETKGGSAVGHFERTDLCSPPIQFRQSIAVPEQKTCFDHGAVDTALSRR
jgi:hypothetical protein